MAAGLVDHAGHHFDHNLRCQCGVHHSRHQVDQRPCDSQWHQGREQKERNLAMMREIDIGCTIRRVSEKYRISETQVRAIRRKMEGVE